MYDSKYRRLIVLGSLICWSTYAKKPKVDRPPVDNPMAYLREDKNMTILGRLQEGKALVLFLQDKYGNKFCVKQLNRKSARFSLILEVVAAKLAHIAGIPVIKADIVPCNFRFAGKILKDQLASIQTVAPGSSITQCGEYKVDLYLQQRVKERTPEKERGLTMTVIKGMSLHPDLPTIVAFDTFTGNPDRSQSNLSYDKRTKRFCGIDLELSFKRGRNLSDIACRRITEYMEDRSLKLTKRELQGLRQYNEVLRMLVETCTPEVMHTILDETVAQSGCFAYGVFRVSPDKNIQLYTELHKRHMSSLYKSAKRLVKLVDTFLKKQESV